MKVIVKRSFAGGKHGSWGTMKGKVQEMPPETAKMAIAAGFAVSAEPPKPKRKKTTKK